MVKSAIFTPSEYLNTYYRNNPREDYEEGFHLHWWQHCYDEAKPTGKLLVIGAGPVIYSLITASKYVNEIHVTDKNQACLEEISRWIDNKGHDWSDYIRRAMEFESGNTEPAEITKRSNLIREKKITYIGTLDILKNPTGTQYEIVDAHFVLECLSSSREDFDLSLKHSLNCLKKNGYFQGGFLQKSDSWSIGKERFPSVALSDNDIIDTLKAYGIEMIKMSTTKSFTDERTGGYIFVQGIKR